jgi:serine/threonine protein phosphatase PrpC
MSSCHPALIRAYLENVLAALANKHHQHAVFLAQHTLDLLALPHSPTFSPLQLTSGIALDEGVVRAGRLNQDYAFATSFTVKLPFFPLTGGLFVVADGMGGHANGADASRLAVHTFVDALLPRLLAGTVQQDKLKDALVEAVQAANQAIYNENREAVDKMGTTLTAAVGLGSTWYAANVGDSRTYIARPGHPLVQITEDHSIVAKLVRDGQISPDAVYTHPQRHLIYRCLGEKLQVEVDTFDFQVEDGSVLLLCSDGLWEMLSDVQQIKQILLNSGLDAASRAEHLARRANAAGGADNIGIVVVSIAVPDVCDAPTVLVPPQSLLIDQMASRSETNG